MFSLMYYSFSYIICSLNWAIQISNKLECFLLEFKYLFLKYYISLDNEEKYNTENDLIKKKNVYKTMSGHSFLNSSKGINKNRWKLHSTDASFLKIN